MLLDNQIEDHSNSASASQVTFPNTAASTLAPTRMLNSSPSQRLLEDDPLQSLGGLVRGASITPKRKPNLIS